MDKIDSSQTSSGCPFHSFSKSDLTYNDYLKIPEILKLQVPQSTPPHHDELLFIVIHQAYELWFKLILHEMENSILYMKEGKPLRAQHFLNRIVHIMRLLVQQIHILETMSPVEFLQFRDSLTPASGFQSTQFREIEFMAGLKDEKLLGFFKDRPDFLELLNQRLAGPDLSSTYFQMLSQLGYSLPAFAADYAKINDAEKQKTIIQGILPIYQNPTEHLPVYLLSESLIELDEQLTLWREHHVKVVERVIGTKPGTGGSPGASYLRSTTTKRCFPYLWDLRGYLQKIPQ